MIKKSSRKKTFSFLKSCKTTFAFNDINNGLADQIGSALSNSFAKKSKQPQSGAVQNAIAAAGVAPADVFRDIAANAEFFASFAKDGGQNLINAGVAARKLGLDMSAVSSISESLLNFEESIGAQLEASMLLGRQINLDRARQLALTGDQEGMMQEILKQVGGEAEFNRMNVIQRKALAESVGVNVEQLSRLVRNNTAGAPGAAVGAATAGRNPLLGPTEEIRDGINGMRRDMRDR